MLIYLINLERHAARLQHMQTSLRGLPFERVGAVDGRTVEGPETGPSGESSVELLDRYNRACILSHRLAWTKFLTTTAPYACILEDDLLFSADFPKFVTDDSWIPPGCSLVKIETTFQKIFLSRKFSPCLNRAASSLRSTHLGTAAYIVSRSGAHILLEATVRPDRPADYLIFGQCDLREILSVRQLHPALATQAKNVGNRFPLPEFHSAIQMPGKRKPKSLSEKIRNETVRPFRQVGRLIWPWLSGQQFLQRRCSVKFI